MMKVILLAIACLSYGILTPQTVEATTSQLTQEITPIQCTYTVFTTDTETMTPTQCSNPLIPMLSTVTTTLKPRQFTGTFASTQTSGLRVWVGENWFTLGVSSALTVDGDNWTLDLADTSLVLVPGTDRTVIVEATTVNGHVLSIVYKDVLVINNTKSSTSKNSSTPTGAIKPISLMESLSHSDMSRYDDKSSTVIANHKIDNIKSSSSSLIGYWTTTIVAFLIGVIILMGIVFMRLIYPTWKRRSRR